MDAGLVEVLHAEEATRAHGFAGAITLVTLGILPFVAFLGGDPTLQLSCITAQLLMGLFSLGVWWVTREAADGTTRYRPRLLRAHSTALVVGVTFVELYFGPFSPAPIVLTLGVYYLGQSIDPVASRWLPALVIATYAALASSVAAGWVEDRGLFAADGVSTGVRVFASAACVVVLVVTALLAKLARSTLRQAVKSSHDASLLAQQRDAQLAEARNQLDRALRLAVGKPGRHTGSMAGDFELGMVIGIGAIGEVYEGLHSDEQQRVAVKLLQSDAAARPELVERFLREGDIMRRIDSPHVTRVIDVGQLEDGAPYLAMELLHGRDLAARLRQEGRLRIKDLVRLAEHLGAALERAHAEGVVHRDLKPLNIFEVEENGRPVFKVLDFGISKLEQSSGTLTRHGLVGTPGYMSPEQARSAEVDRRSDIFSAALVLYRAMTGRPPFPGDNTPQMMFDIVYKMPARPSSMAQELPRDVDLVMAIALAKDPAHRFEEARDFVGAFIAAARGKLPAHVRAHGELCSRAYPWGRTIAGLDDDLEESL